MAEYKLNYTGDVVQKKLDVAPYTDGFTWKEIQPECHPELVANEDIFNRFMHVDLVNLTVGETYIVNWNGVDYRCVAKTPDMVSYDAAPVYAILGNTAKMDETGDTGEPFVITVGRYRDTDPSEYQIYGFDGSTELTLSICQETENIHKLSGKYVEGMGWSEKSTKEVLPETVLSEPMGYEDGFYAHVIDFVPEVGAEYIVVYNGTEHKRTVAKDMYDEILFIGDLGDPFIVSYNADEAMCVFGSVDSSVTLSIYTATETVHPIDKKFLPSGGSHLRVVITMDENENYLSSKTYEEIKNHVLNGGTCDCVFGIYLFHLTKATFLNDVQTFDLVYEVVFANVESDTLMYVRIRENGRVNLTSYTLSLQEI